MLKKKKHLSDFDSCYKKAIDILTRREHSKLELIQKLKAKNFSDTIIFSVIEIIVKKKYQSDERFAEAFIDMCFNQGKGPLIISMELKKRGVENIDLSKYDWTSLAKNIRAKKYNIEIPKDYKEITKQKRFLQSRGFGFDDINNAFKV